jgi:hypothetical protein
MRDFNLECYLETHYQVVAAIEREVDKDIENSVVWKRLETNGTGGLWMLAKELTDEFEQLHTGREWDGEWLDTLEEFLNGKLNG